MPFLLIIFFFCNLDISMDFSIISNALLIILFAWFIKSTDFNFFAKLALIGVATGVASGLIRKIGSSSSGGGASNTRGSGYNSDISSRGRDDVRHTGEFIVRGPDLVLALRNQNYKGGRLG